ncbi:DUF2671 domain-containing protein [Rickettsia endosymbiont of Culicoides newsteadi]|uniref:DUF2671 domain-containing protein n=1 Tax=Rickettsia endosymbiont of Culicoides newsteadi TaxID=1961830 RepID=UPI000B9B3E21|nr:DUF2671 domain-containing protein [Rickettsia endosymbiont of Culicoides newsteadi]OZG32517.1 hypothetical protein RiCNE_00740 [Rickettsia endosymbiont of Culicoides newsteadi]
MKEKNIPILNSLTKKATNSLDTDNNPFFNVRYIGQSTTLITESIQKGFDVAQLSNGDITVTEIKTVNVHYNWDPVKQKFIKINQN